MKSAGLPLLAILAGCGDKANDSGGTSQAEPVAVAGSYNVQVEWVSGCDGDPSIVQAWAEGPLRVSGSGSALEYDFGDPAVFAGTVDGAGSATFAGQLTQGTDRMDIWFSGHYEKTSEEAWILEGRLEIEVDDDEFTTNNCTVESGIRASELVSNG